MIRNPFSLPFPLDALSPGPLDPLTPKWQWCARGHKSVILDYLWGHVLLFGAVDHCHEPLLGNYILRAALVYPLCIVCPLDGPTTPFQGFHFYGLVWLSS